MDRGWMYHPYIQRGVLHPDFVKGLTEFISFATNHPECMDGSKIKCPCNQAKCQNARFEDPDTVRSHVVYHGFVPNYYNWVFHGEPVLPIYGQYQSGYFHGEGSGTAFQQFGPDRSGYYHGECSNTHQFHYDQPSNAFERMEMDAGGSQFHAYVEQKEQSPNTEAQRFFDMLHTSNEPIWPGCKTESKLSVVSQMINMKAKYGIPNACYDQLCQLMKQCMPSENVMLDNFYETKKLLRGMGLSVEKIHCCIAGCMIYWGDDCELIFCKVCGHPRYKSRRDGSSTMKPFKKMYYFPLTPRLQRLYASEATAKDMRWHAEHETEDASVMCHPSDSPAWKHFDQIHPRFSTETRNVRLGLCADGFQPFSQSEQQYSLWLITVTPYNLPPWMCMKDEFIFLSVIVPGPRNPKEKLDVFLQPLIVELIHLWEVGELTYDVSTKQNFQLRAALMWTISDFPAYSMLSGWSTVGLKACPYCMEDAEAFTLEHGGKTSWFDNHRKFLPSDHPFRRNTTAFKKKRRVSRIAPPIKSGIQILKEIDEWGFMKVTEPEAEEINVQLSGYCGWKKRSIFWDLPYWFSNLMRHNIDVMHVEKNVFENVFNTIMNVKGKTKDNTKSREDLQILCQRSELAFDPAIGKYPKACYTLDKQSQEILCEWVKQLRFSDGYASNMGRCVDMSKQKLFGMKSHDCHVFMQRLIPIAFRELLPTKVWETLTELSLFFKNLTLTVIKKEDMRRLESEIPVILCKLERIFPPSFFDSMEHLPTHLAYEARIAGPVQYRWMYPFERYFRKSKSMVRNKASVEGSICETYLTEEASKFFSYYFEPNVITRPQNVSRNLSSGYQVEQYEDNFSIFTLPGKPLGKENSRWLTDEEIKGAHTYILLNCPEVQNFITIFRTHKKNYPPYLTESQIGAALDVEFSNWFMKFVQDPINNVSNIFLQALAMGPLRSVKCYSGYRVNGYKFRPESYGSTKASTNSGVCVKGSNYINGECDYYGRLLEVLQLEYTGWPVKQIMLFKCNWFDPTPNVGTRVHYKYPSIVEVNRKRRLSRYNPFVLAIQATQVCYVNYPSLRRDRRDWLAVCKIISRSCIDLPFSSNAPSPSAAEPFQDDESDLSCIQVQADEDPGRLNDDSGSFIDISDDELEDETDFRTNFDDQDDNLYSNYDIEIDDSD